MALLEPGHTVLRFKIFGVEVKHIFETCANVLGVVDQAGEPEPGLLVPVVGLDNLREQRARLIAPAGYGGADALIEESVGHAAYPAL
jgi:hypothetical protein